MISISDELLSWNNQTDNLFIIDWVKLFLILRSFVWQKVAPVLQKSLYPDYFVIFALLNHSDKKLTMISLFQSDDEQMMDEKVVSLLHSECITSEQTEYLNMNIMLFLHKYLVPATQNLVLANLWKWMV